MTFSQSVSVCFRKMLTFSGRATRSEFWFFTLFTSLFDLLSAGQVILEKVIQDSSPSLQLIISVTSVVVLIVRFSIGIIYFSVATRRLHDIGKSGWAQLLLFVPFIGWIVLAYWYSRPSDKGSNEYGLDPFQYEDNL